MSVEEPELTRNQIYYARHREEKRQKVKERYHNDPAVLARRAERERVKAEQKAQREAEKAAKKEEAKQKKQMEKEKQMAERNLQRLALIADKVAKKEEARTPSPPPAE